MTFEHNGEHYRIEFDHIQFKAPITIDTLYRGPRDITAITNCFVVKGKDEDEEMISSGASKCAVGDRFIKKEARERALRRAADDIEDRVVRGKVFQAYFSRTAKQ